MKIENNNNRKKKYLYGKELKRITKSRDQNSPKKINLKDEK